MNIPGFRPLITMMDPRKGHNGCWQRFWFVVEEVNLYLTNDGSILDSTIQIKALTETENNGGEQDPVAVTFTSHINEHFEEYAILYPELAQLKLCALATATAIWLFQRGKLDPSVVFNYKPIAVDTTDSTPGIIVESPNVSVEITANGTRTHKIMLFGGVDMNPKVEIHEDSRPALRRFAQAVRKGNEQVWEFCRDNVSYIASAISLHRKPSVAQEPRLEICVPSNKDSRVVTRRERTQSSHDPVLVLHEQDGNASLYRRVEPEDRIGRKAFCRVLSQTQTDNGTSFQFSPREVLYHNWLNKFIRSDCEVVKMVFNKTGRLIECTG